MDSRPLLEDSLQLLSFAGLNPFSSDLKIRIFGMCTATFVIGISIDVCLILGLNYQGIDSTMEVLVAVAIIQIFMKMLFLLINKNEIVILIKTISKFWRPNLDDLEQHEENEKIFSFVKSCKRLYIGLIFLVSALSYIRPIFAAEIIDLPYKSYCSKFLVYKVCYVLEFPQILILALMQIGFDILYVSFITNIICEFKLLKSRFPNLRIDPNVHGTDKEVMDELIKLIDHHNLILKCTKMIKYIYRVPLVSIFATNMFGLCFSLIIMTAANADNSLKIQFGTLAVVYLTQLFFYCISGSLLADESSKISFEVYKLKWWIKTQPELRKTIIMVIRRSNKHELLTAGGLLQVNLQTFTMILRSSVSFFTFMQVIYGNS